MTKTKKKTAAKRKATNAVSRKEILEHVKSLVPKAVSRELANHMVHADVHADVEAFFPVVEA